MRDATSICLVIFVIFISSILTIQGSRTKLDLNTATKEQLVTIEGIGPSYAARIIIERERRGGFRSVKDLLKIRGIGRKLLQRIENRVEVIPFKEKDILKTHPSGY